MQYAVSEFIDSKGMKGTTEMVSRLEAICINLHEDGHDT